MTSITIGHIEDDLKKRLRIRAAQHGHSMEEGARIILRRDYRDECETSARAKGLALSLPT